MIPGVDVRTVSYHLGQIDESGELHLSDTIRKIRIPSDKWSGEVMMYNLDVVIAVGYRVNSYEYDRYQVLKSYWTHIHTKGPGLQSKPGIYFLTR